MIAVQEQTLQIAAYDGTAWGDWTDFTLTTLAANALPTVSVKVPSSLTHNKWYREGTNGFEITTADADGDTITKYQIKTTSEGHRFYGRNIKTFIPNGTVEITAVDFGLFYVTGYPSYLKQTASIQLVDGEAWGDWTDFTLTSGEPNNLPTVSVKECHHH